jgi:chromosome segregation ATPase
MALGIVLGDLDSTTKAFTDLKVELEKEKAAREVAQAEVNTLTWTVKDLEISTNKFATQVPILEEKVKHLETRWLTG